MKITQKAEGIMRKLIHFLVIGGLLLWQTPVFSAYKMTPRQAFYYHASRGDKAALLQLQQKGYLIDLSDEYGNSPLCEAVLKKDTLAIQTLIQMGADTQADCLENILTQSPVTLPESNGVSAVLPKEVDQRQNLASLDAVNVPSPPPKPLSKNTKVGIGLGVTALAGAGVGAALLFSGGGGGGGSKGKCVDGTWVKGKCKCNAHATGAACDSCEAGYGMHGTKSCHKDKVCKINAEQIGDVCQCKSGYDFEGDTACYPDEGCDQFVNMKQSKQSGQCVCDVQEAGKTYIITSFGCYEKLDCPTHQVQIDDKCVCDADHPVSYGGECYEVLACQHGGKQNGPVCDCPLDGHWGGTLCEVCESGYVLNAGVCKEDKGGESLIGKEGTENTYSGGILIDNIKMYGNVYGLYNSGTSSSDTLGGNNGNSKIEIKNESNANIYGIHGNSVGGDTYGIKTTTSHATGDIWIENDGTGDIYGILGKANVYGAYDGGQPVTNNITILSKNSISSQKIYGMYGEGAVYGVFDNVGQTPQNKIEIINTGHSDIYGIYGKGTIYGVQSKTSGPQNSINITNVGNGNIYGIYGEGKVYGTNFSYTGTTVSTGKNYIAITNDGSGNVFGMYGIGDVQGTTVPSGTLEPKDTNVISITSNGEGVYGIYTKGELKNTPGNSIVINYLGEGQAHGIRVNNNTGAFDNRGPITITREESAEVPFKGDGGTAYGISVKGDSTKTKTVENNGIISISSIKNATGIYIENGAKTTVKSKADITVADAVNAYGIWVKDGATSTVENSATISVEGTEKAYGIYIENGTNAKVTNTGTIAISGDGETYGIYVQNGASATITNTGTITINGTSDPGHEIVKTTSALGGIVLSGSKLKTSGMMSSTDTLNLDTFDGTIVAQSGAKFNITNALAGKLYIDSDTVTHGFNKIYTEHDMIQAGDTSKLKLVSDSALFNAKLAGNGRDVIMTMKSFDEATNNPSLAKFLTQNYISKNNESFYNKLKSFNNMDTLTDSLNKLTGRNMLSRFNFEDMTMIRELNFDMNNKLFHNSESQFSLAGSVAPLAFKGDVGSNARYSLFNKRNGNKSIGLGIAFMNVHSNNSHESDNRQETMYQLILPMGYKVNGFNLIASPRIGYARGTYDRLGFDGKSYKGVMEKRVFGLMNEVRYPMMVGKWKFEPAVEFNMLGYQQKGYEDAKEFALNIQNQNTYSVEGGIGVHISREEDLGKETMLKLTAGIMAYHEFADPYRLKVGMNGMDGAFTLHDENRSDNRGVIRAGFDYIYQDLSLYGSLSSYLDREVRTSAKTGMKVKF